VFILTDRTSGGTATPYADAARAYRELGWRGVLPADLNGRPGHVPAGYSGGHDADPDDDQVAAWVTSHAAHNVALRLPDDVLGLDVDVYGGKRGDQTVAYVAEQLGAGDLPPTWTSTARGADQPSRIHLYRVPAGGRWRSDLGRGSSVEVIRRGHRWVRCWPSRNPKLPDGDGYRWYRPDGTVSDRPPRPEELAELPQSWLDVLRDGAAVALPDRASPGERGDHRHDDAPVLDQDGQPVDPDLVLDRGLPIGAQQTELFRYMCSLRARNLRRSEMIVLGMVALQRLENDPAREPWTAADVTELVDRVRREYAPGGTGAQLTPAMQAFAARFRDGGGAAVVDEPVPTEESATDLGNSLRFARLFRDRVRYAADIQRWYVWDGRRWAPDRTNRVLDLTKHVIDDVRRQAFADPDHRDEWLTWANRSEALQRRSAIIGGAVAEPNLVVLSDVFDTDPDLLVVRNGTVDLRTGELRPSDPGDLNSHLAEVELDPDADAPRWRGHVDLVTAGSAELARYLARAVGYSLTGDVGARSFFFLEGDGSNGKNAFVEPIIQLLGSYAQTTSTALLTGDDQQHPTIMADLLGSRLVFIDETRQGRKLNVERIKALTGSKKVKARFMRRDFFEFDAQFKLWIAGNGRPTVDDPSDGVWTRLHRVVCHGKVDPARRVDRFGDVLYREEASGILNWALAGLLDWRRGGLAVPAAVVADVQEYRDEEDYDAQFVDEWLDVTGDPAHRLVVDDVYTVYRYWAERAGLARGDVRNKAHLGRQLKRLGVETGGKPVKIGGRATRLMTRVRWQEGTPLHLALPGADHGGV
jgi:P4 family phage/plasmid primase-like protien